MNCREPGCDRKEFMARELCDRHQRMLPAELLTRIRKTIQLVRTGRTLEKKELREKLEELYEQAHDIIGEHEAHDRIVAEIATFRTHMASVAGVVAALRTIPVDDLRTQLSTSAESLKRTDPDGHEQQRNKIEMDLEILELLGETRARLGDLIKRWQPVMAPDPAGAAE